MAGRHYLTKAEINALYFATHSMARPRGWDAPVADRPLLAGALVVLFNYGVDTGTVWESSPVRADPLAARLVGPPLARPRGQGAVAVGLAVLPEGEDGQGVPPTDEQGGARAHQGHHAGRPPPRRPRLPGRGPSERPLPVLCTLAGIRPRLDVETGREEPWELKDLRKTCATYHDEHVPESSVEILGHSVGGITYRHYAHRAPSGVQGDHDAAAADGIPGPVEG